METIQALPYLTPTNYMINRKKRSRSSDHDFESNYFKKRLISNSHFPTTPPPQADEQQIYNDTAYELNNYFFTNEAAKGYVTLAEKQVETIDDMDDDYYQHNQVSTSKYSQDSQIQVLDVKGIASSDKIRYTIPSFVLKDQLPIPLQITTMTEQSGQLILYRPPKTLLPPSPSTSATDFQSSSNEEEDTDDTFEAMDLD